MTTLLSSWLPSPAALGSILAERTETVPYRTEVRAARRGDRSAFEPVSAPAPVRPAAGQAVLATWSQLLDAGRLQDGEPFLAGTARTAVARVSAATAEALGVSAGAAVTVSTDRGALTAPVLVTEMPDGVVWLPTNAAGLPVRRELAAAPGSVVRVAAATR